MKLSFQFPEIKPIVFKPIVFEPIVFKPIPAPMKTTEIRTYVPGNNENFVAYSSSQYSTSTNNNGKKSSTAGSEVLTNVNGDVKEKVVAVALKDKDDNDKETDAE